MQMVVAVTGASGAVYARRMLEVACAQAEKVHLIVSEYGRRVALEELAAGGEPGGDLRALLHCEAENCVAYEDSDLTAPLASGSSEWQAMVVVPCSMGTLGRIAAGTADTLIARAADVTLKERRRLVLVCRETPLSLVHLRNMVMVTEAGAIVLPPAPAWYHRPKEMTDLVDFVVQKVCDAVGLEVRLVPRWEGPSDREA